MTNELEPPDRDTIAAEYFEQLPFTPYPVQEEGYRLCRSRDRRNTGTVFGSERTFKGRRALTEQEQYQQMLTEGRLNSRPFCLTSFITAVTMSEN